MPGAMSRGSFYDDFPATSILIVTCIGFYGLEVIYQHKIHETPPVQAVWVGGGPDILLSLGATSFRELVAGEVWRLVSYAFLHFGIGHILLNMLSLAGLGRICEPMLGTHRFTVVYFTTGVAAALVSAGFHYVVGSPGGVGVGASGAIFGLVGLLFGFSFRHRDRMLRSQLLSSLIPLAILTIFIRNIDHSAHAGGALAGLAFGFFTPRYVTSESARRWRIPYVACLALTVVALGFAVWNRLSIPILR